jgi:hypothetical protein
MQCYQQSKQPQQPYCSTHKWNIVISHDKETWLTYSYSMCLWGPVLSHLAGTLLHKYAMHRCPTKTKVPWKKEEIRETVAKGHHALAMSPEALEHFRLWAEEKTKCLQAKILLWDDIKDSPPAQMKVLPIAAIPHK